MQQRIVNIVQAVIVGLFFLHLTGCAAAVTVLGTVGSGIAMGAEQLMEKPVSKTVSHEFDRMKTALLVALCKMEIPVGEAREIVDGEEILAKADELEIEIELKEITPCVTRIAVKAKKSLLHRDNATAEEIVKRTTHIAQDLNT